MRTSSICFLVFICSTLYVSADRGHGDKLNDEEPDTNYTVTHEAWFEVEIKDHEGHGDNYYGKFHVGLFGDTVPMTVLNFVSLAKGYKVKTGGSPQRLYYKNTPIHRIVQDFVIQMGDVTTMDGLGGASIFGPQFNDENFILSHRSAGFLSMANGGPDSNGSQFFITLVKARWLDNKHVVFGKIIKGMDVIRTLSDLPVNPLNAVPKKRVKIIDCDAEVLKSPYVLTNEQIDADGSD